MRRKIRQTILALEAEKRSIEGAIAGLRRLLGAHARESSKRETEVLILVSRGLSNKEIAKAFGISQRTVKFHVSNLLRKFGVTSRYELADMAEEKTP